MRVVINTLATLKPKTGVGHYAARLADGLRGHLGPDAVTTFPGPLLAALCRHTVPGSVPPGARNSGWRPQLARGVKSLGRRALGLAFRTGCHPGRFDLYHEPNFLAFASQLPTVITVHDLSVLLHPQWHPADRVR